MKKKIKPSRAQQKFLKEIVRPEIVLKQVGYFTFGYQILDLVATEHHIAPGVVYLSKKHKDRNNASMLNNKKNLMKKLAKSLMEADDFEVKLNEFPEGFNITLYKHVPESRNLLGKRIKRYADTLLRSFHARIGWVKRNSTRRVLVEKTKLRRFQKREIYF